MNSNPVIVSSISSISPDSWNQLANPDDLSFEPFLCHDFLMALEASGCVGNNTGWTPAHLVMRGTRKQITGIIPLYKKNHSQGEYVFDHGWASAYEQAGGAYYPKLQGCVPFTPVTNRRLLCSNQKQAKTLINALQDITTKSGISSTHVTFCTDTDARLFRAAGWMERLGMQFHFHNPGYASYEEFLATLSSRKRKALRSERKKANKDIEIISLAGDDLQPRHWDAFFKFYQDTGARKWGRPYLNREFFDLLHQTMRKNILLILAKRDNCWIAGALHFIGGDCLYGRYWGCTQYQDSLHFELCYHRAIEYAIAHNLPRVEAGAQGDHKIARGYSPVLTRSFHYIVNSGFSHAVQEFLNEESKIVKQDFNACLAASPYKDNRP